MTAAIQERLKRWEQDRGHTFDRPSESRIMHAVAVAQNRARWVAKGDIYLSLEPHDAQHQCVKIVPGIYVFAWLSHRHFRYWLLVRDDWKTQKVWYVHSERSDFMAVVYGGSSLAECLAWVVAEERGEHGV